MKTKIFLSGPVSHADPKQVARNRRRFHRWARIIGKRGYAVLNPATLPLGMEYGDYMHICYGMVDVADGIFLLDGWRDSPGAKAEYDYALAKGLILLQEEMWK